MSTVQKQCGKINKKYTFKNFQSIRLVGTSVPISRREKFEKPKKILNAQANICHQLNNLYEWLYSNDYKAFIPNNVLRSICLLFHLTFI